MMPTVAADYCTQLIDMLDMARRGLQTLQKKVDREGASAGIGQFNNYLVMQHLAIVHVRTVNVLNILVKKDVLQTDEVGEDPGTGEVEV